MTKFQIADEVNGPFGAQFDTREAAEAEMNALVSDLMEKAKQEVLLLEQESAEREYREPAAYSESELNQRAEARIRDFHCIVEVDDV